MPLLSCSHLFSPTPETSPEAQAMIAQAQQRNSRLKTFKGVGSVKVNRDGARHTARVMWAGAPARRMIRVEVLELSGRPLLSIAGDGERLNAYVHESRKFYTSDKTEVSLKRFLSVAVTMDDLLEMLTGAIPIRPHRFAQIEEGGTSGRTCLTLKDSWGRTLEKVFWGPDGQDAEKIEFFLPSGEMVYRVEFSGTETAGEYRFPKQLVISGKDGDGATLRIDRCLPDVALPDAMFDLKPPENS